MHEPIDRAMARAGYSKREVIRELLSLPHDGPRPTSALLRKLVEALDPVDMSAVAARAGTSLGTVKSWRNRHADFPAPIATLAIGPVFAWAEVEAWLEGRRNGRAKPAEDHSPAR
jgi:hypothetical protein